MTSFETPLTPESLMVKPGDDNIWKMISKMDYPLPKEDPSEFESRNPIEPDGTNKELLQ